MKSLFTQSINLLKHRTIVTVLVFSLISACQTIPSLTSASSAPKLSHDTVSQNDASAHSNIPVIDFSQNKTLADILPNLSKKRVVFVGESHDQYHHHLSQLNIIQALYALNPELAIGLEFFQRPFQKFLDAYVKGEINEQTMLEKTEYFKRWKFDYRLYQPILKFAKEKNIPLIALNLPEEITKKVGREGLQSLSSQEQKSIPASIDRNVSGYRERIEAVFQQHPGMEKRNIQNFIDVQLLWDEGMAETAANYLQKNKTKQMVILAGSGHIIYGTGIPIRLERRIKSDTATIVHGDRVQVEKGIADYVLFPLQQSLPKKGLIGILLLPAERGMLVDSFSKTSKAKNSGMKKGDRIIAIDGRKIDTFPDIRLAIWNKLPGDSIEITVLRSTDKNKDQQITLEVELSTATAH